MSRKLGAKQIDEATKYSSTSFFLSFSLGVLLAVCTFLFMEPLLLILGSTVTILPYAEKYIFFIVLAAPLFTGSLTLNNLLRYEGKAKLGTIGLLIGAILNIGCDAIFLFGLQLGIAGAGLATALSQTVSFGILLSMFLSGRTQTKIGLKYVAKDRNTIWQIIATGFPSLLRQGLNSVATMLLNRCAGTYGDAAVSAMSIVSRVSFFALAIAIGIGQGFQPISSFNFGAGKKDRVQKAFWYALSGMELILFLLMIPMTIFAAPLIRLLRDDVQVIEYGIRALRLLCVGQLFIPLSMMVEMGFQSMGEKLLASIGSSLRSGVVFIPVLLILYQCRGLEGVQEAQPISFVLTFVVSLFLCRIYLKRLQK